MQREWAALSALKLHATIAGVAYMAAICLCGCARDPVVPQEIVRGLAEAESPASANPEPARRRTTRSLDAGEATVEAMRPMMGFWVVDVEATMNENAGLPTEGRTRLRYDLENYPFELQITASDYISRSLQKTIEDRYWVVDVTDNVVTIQFAAKDWEPRHNRKTRLKLRDGKLLIIPSREMSVVMARTWRSAGAMTLGRP